MILGETISHYRVLSLLGAGGMGEVYKAEDTKLKRAVALKFLPLSLVQDRDAKERLMHEAQAASALDHPNICTIHEIDETPDGRVFLAMAFYEGETLKARIARGLLSVDDALNFTAQITRAVAAAHEAGIIHRDIKPANVIVTTRSEVKLLDFGIAKQSGQTALTRTGTTVGTVAYMAPEHITGRGADERSDIWSLGVVLFEMLAGRPPFTGEHEVAVLRAIADSQPPSLASLRRDLPAAVQTIVEKALQKEPKDRYATASELLRDVDTLRAPTVSLTAGHVSVSEPTARPSNRRRLAIAAAATIAVLSVGGWFLYRNARVRWARQQALPQISDLIQKEQYAAAFRLMHQAEPYVRDDPEFVKLQSGFLYPTTIRTTPPGAELYLKGYTDVNGEWEHVGQGPLEMRGPLGYFRWRVTKAGFTPFEGADAAAGLLGDITFRLDPEGALPQGMVRVPGGSMTVGGEGGSLRLEDSFLDKFEVTNREYKQFVNAAGYRTRDFWQHEFVKDGRPLSWEEAMAEFRDTTGRPGPATWELGSYPDGQDDVPVHGVSWYEAAAYARFVGKELPTVYHWRRAAAFGIYSDILELSNFGGQGPARVGSSHAIGQYGTYDMAGNVKEWCWNAAGSRRYILGGGWNEPNYQFQGADARLPIDRSANNGFRLMKRADASPIPEAALRPLDRFGRDYSRETPVSDDVYRVYEGLYAYDASDLKPSIESTDEQSPFWRVQRIAYNATDGKERIIAYLFLPKTTQPPYQTVVYFPHSGGFALRSFEQAEMSNLGFIVKAGRALLFPMYKGMYERRVVGGPTGPNAIRDSTIQQVKDLRRSVDYLETRDDIDRTRLAYFGVSYGAAVGPISLALERRFKAAVFWSGGFRLNRPLAEVDALNFAPHVATPILMLNGREDFTFPVEESQQPMFRLLGTPNADKQHVLYDGGHVFPFARVQKDSLEWLDRYLGVPH
jgi:dienelactone hydrolase